MMDDRQIIELLRDQGSNTSGLDPARIIVGAKRRRLRNRMTVGLASAAAVTVALSGVVAAGALSGQPDSGTGPVGQDDGTTRDRQPSVASEPAADGAYEPVEVSRSQVVERCTTVLGNQGVDGPWQVAPGEHGPWFEGERAEVARPGNPSFAQSCQIPQSGLVDAAATVPTPLPNAGVPDGVRAACGQYLGWDFSGWEVVTAAGTDLATTAALRSTNGYLAECILNAAPGLQEDGSWVAIEPESATQPDPTERDYTVWLYYDQQGAHTESDNASGGYSIFNVGRLFGPREATTVVLVEPDGTEHTGDVVDGWYAIAEDLHLEMNPHGVFPLQIKVLAADGTVLADYADGEQQPNCHPEPNSSALWDGC